ncbi:hypothetical protein GJU39_23055 [Pedobacter petrophilus]|uniref:ATP-binding protein n=1 Tax=Pedobacter petrophilus TaxID=1908241 RepID=A0A7K0G7H9_9SPHI|nr:ATP-binding protein [Pedobacter petrophilus]MRX78946.1 hypothetical protein [Pedobacter petrophilus]
MQTIAKEGIKYGVKLLLITQRPSELDETILSQFGTLIALRMTNVKDRGHVGSVMPNRFKRFGFSVIKLKNWRGINHRRSH